MPQGCPQCVRAIEELVQEIRAMAAKDRLAAHLAARMENELQAAMAEARAETDVRDIDGLDPEHAQMLVEAGYDDLDSILGDPNIDAVVFATPHSQHEEHIKAAAAARKHIFVEKPFTLEVESARRALDAANSAGVVLGIDFQRRFHPSIAEIRDRTLGAGHPAQGLLHGRC